MEQNIQDHCVKSAIVSLPLTIIGVATKSITEKNVTHVLENHNRQPLLHLHGKGLVIKKIVTVKCVALQLSILIN